jgi:hypothetical protein
MCELAFRVLLYSDRLSLSLSLSLWDSVRVTWRESSFTGNFENCFRHVKEGFGKGASLSLQILRKGNLKRGLKY